MCDKSKFLVKLSDFGLATRIKDNKMYTMCGTPQYLAPEVFTGASGAGYGMEIDMWSAGVLLFFLLSGCLPFQEDSKHTVQDKIQLGLFEFTPKEIWKTTQQN